ncbi:MAG: hypothetical protein LBN21_12140, partial [Treponema sp.]|nr:hypothetical protein [Treponema sp.]
MVERENSAQRHYFDWAAAAVPDVIPADPPAGAVFFGNPSSPYLEGRQAKQALEDARERCAAVLGVPPETIYFTS